MNINRVLKNIKLDVVANFTCVKNKEMVITISKIASLLNLQSIEKYIKNAYYIETNQIESLRLPQLKLFLKIIGISYISKTTNTYISSNKIEKIIKDNHIFNNIFLVSKPRVIKVSSKSDMSIIWINI